MTPEQIAIVRETYARAAQEPDRLAADFHARLFAAAPELRPRFGDDPARLRRRFLAELDAVVAALDHLGTLLEHTQGLGRRHAHLRLRARDFRRFGEALVDAVGAAVGPDFTHEARVAWRQAYSLVSETMQAAAVAARP